MKAKMNQVLKKAGFEVVEPEQQMIIENRSEVWWGAKSSQFIV